MSINNLMMPNDKRWNENTVRQVFSAELANKILTTPFVAHVQSDRLVWKAERNGKYSVKSAYRLCVEELIDTSHLCCPGKWSSIWKLKVPPKVRNLIWRVCRRCLPMRFDSMIKEYSVLRIV
jgi:hypothetical protein